jgi:hypothetical protein
MITDDYTAWIENARKFSNMGDYIYTPQSTNFLKTIGPVFIYEGDVYAVKSKQFDTADDLENFLESNDNVALFYAYSQPDTEAVVARITVIGQDQMMPKPMADVVAGMSLRSDDQKFGTLEGLQKQASELKSDVGKIHCLVDNGNNFSIEAIVADRTGTVYV